jgi:hypothetical protein
MNYAEYLRGLTKASNSYKSNWQGRDASEVTLRNSTLANNNNQTTHKGPGDSCIPCENKITSSTNIPGNGYNTDYSMDIITNRNAGGMAANDPVWGTAGGVTLRTAAEVSTLSYVTPNPVKTTSCYASDPGVKFRPIANSSNFIPVYSGWRNHVPVTNTGVLPDFEKKYPYPSG